MSSTPSSPAVLVETRPVCYACGTEFWGVPGLAEWDILLGSHIRNCPEVMWQMSNVDLTTARKFSFPSQGPWIFRWIEGTRLVYVYRNSDAPYAQEATGISHELPPTYESAQEAAKSWVRSRYGFGTPAFVANRPTPKRRTTGKRRMADSIVFKKANALREKAQLLVLTLGEGVVSLQEAETRIRIMAGDLPDNGYEKVLNSAFAAVVSAYGPISSPPVEPEDDDGFDF